MIDYFYENKMPNMRQCKKLKNFNWSNYQIYNCQYCKLYFCPELVEIEGNSSPVDDIGIKMMEDSFLKLKKLLFFMSKKRIVRI